MLCVKARLPTKQNADSQKTTCFKCFTETPCFTQTSRKIMFFLRPSTLAAAMLSCSHLHFISSYVLSLLYMFETPKSFQLRPWPQICTPILTAATLYCMHLHFSLLCHVSALKVGETQIALAVVAGGTRQRRLNTKKALELKLS